MERISGVEKNYAWGSDSLIQEAFGFGSLGEPLAEVWFGAHHLSPSHLLQPDGTAEDDPLSLEDWITANPEGTLGSAVVERFGPRLPYLVKFIAPKRPLSLQVHPAKSRAEVMFEAEELAGIALDAPERLYKDPNYKPEIIYALTKFEALAGFRVPRRIVEIFSDIDTELSTQIVSMLRSNPSPDGIRTVVDRLLSPRTAPNAAQVEATVSAMTDRLAAGVSPSVRVNRIVTGLSRLYPGDAGAVVAAMLNPVTLRPGEVLFIPPGGIHAYVSGLGIETMASSDNVLRAGLTEKHVDCQELLNSLDYVAAPPVRIAAEWVTDSTRVFYAPVDDFEFSITRLENAEMPLPGHGGRIIICVEGTATLRDSQTAAMELISGQAVFVRADKTPVYARGKGVVAQVDVP